MAQAKGGTNWFAIIIATVTVVALVGVGALVVMLNNQASAPGVAPVAANINTETGAITFGDGPTTVSTYVDFGCPHCAEFEAAFGELLSEGADANTITLEVHPVAIMNLQYQGTNFSSRTGGALYCVAEYAPEQTLAFMNTLFANQPDTRGFTNEQIISYADKVGASAASDCIADATYADFVDDMTPNLPTDPATGRGGTPTILIDGEYTDLNTVTARLAEILG